VNYVTVAATPKTGNKTSQLPKLFHARSYAKTTARFISIPPQAGFRVMRVNCLEKETDK
jgi:hypothetical protein